jgi:phospholipase C
MNVKNVGGPSWVSSIVNAVGQSTCKNPDGSSYWSTTAIIVTWDDWGGWYDHVDPPEVEKWSDGTQFRYGSRVGCLVLSPYAKSGYISKVVHSHVSLMKFCETTFGLPSLNARDAAADEMSDCFDFTQKPLPSP